MVERRSPSHIESVWAAAPHGGKFQLEETMRRMITGGLLAAAFGTALAVAGPMPASAQLAQPQTAAAIAGSNDLVTEVRWRGRYGWGGGWGYRRWYGPGIGFATGLAIGSAFASPYYYAPAPRVYYGVPSRSSDEIAYCSRRFKSYDVASGTYLGYDGQRHPCP
jgi:hypothetical protein